MTKQRVIAGLAAGAFALGAAALPDAADAQERTIVVGNWLPQHHLIVAGIIEPWAEAIEAETNGELRFDIMPSALGPPPQQFDLLIDGAFDVGYGVSGHNQGRFTMTQVMDLPFMSPDPWAGSAASWLTYEKYGERYGEHEGAKVVGLFMHSEPYIWWREPPITEVAAMEGKKIRVGGNVTGQIVSALGMTPVQIPPTEAQQAMARGVADGITFPGESIEFFGITPVIEGGTRIPGGLYADTFWVAFNAETWNSLSDEHKAAIEKHSGLGIAMRAGWAWTNGDELGLEALGERGVPIETMPEEEVQRVRETLSTFEEEWIAEANARGLPGEEIVSYARAMVDSYRADREVNVP